MIPDKIYIKKDFEEAQDEYNLIEKSDCGIYYKEGWSKSNDIEFIRAGKIKEVLNSKRFEIECTNCKATDDYDLSDFADRIIQELLNDKE